MCIRDSDAWERFFPVNGGPFFCPTEDSLRRADVERWRRRLKERYAPPEFARVLLLLPWALPTVVAGRIG